MQTILRTRKSACWPGAGLLIPMLLLAQVAVAQRSLFNVPMMETEGANQVLFQEQLTVTDQVESGTTFTYGLGGHWEVGLNLSHLNLNYQRHARIVELQSPEAEQNPHLTVNLHKGVSFTDWWIASAGTRSGIAYQGKWAETQLAHFSYLGSQFSIPDTEFKLVGGGYYTNPAYAGEGNNVGYMIGVEVPIVSDKLVFEGEYISGKNQLSNFIGGLGLEIGQSWQLAVGGQIPSPGSGNQYGAVIQLSRQ